MMDRWLAPSSDFVGALVGAAFSPRARRQAGGEHTSRELFDSAISAVRAAQLARHYVPGLPQQILESFTPPSGQQLGERIAASGLERHLDAMHTARLALAALEPVLHAHQLEQGRSEDIRG